MSKRRQGKAKGGRSARHHEPQGVSELSIAREIHSAFDEYLERKTRRESFSVVEDDGRPEELELESGPDAA